jgi:ABC-2 type transport system ATP-binding protein
LAADDPPAALLEDARKSFGGVQALSGLTLSVARGELYGFLGPNGAGKTTAIRALLGLTTLDQGKAQIFGRDAPPRAVIHRVGFVPQEPALYRDLTVRENLELFADVFGLERARWGERFEHVLSFVDLAGKADRIVRDLSGGMVRRTSIAAAMVHDPDLLILDEPTVGVDPELRASFWDHFSDLKTQGKSILITTHYIDEARRCDRVGFISDGRLVAEGAPDDLLKRTSTASLEDAFLAVLRANRGAPA